MDNTASGMWPDLNRTHVSIVLFLARGGLWGRVCLLNVFKVADWDFTEIWIQ